MKKSQLQQIIKEEIQNVLSEIDPTQQGFDAAMKRAGVEPSAGGSNVQRSKEYIEGKRAYLANEKSPIQAQNPYKEPNSHAERMASPYSYAERSKKAKDWTEGFQAAMKSNPPKPSTQPDASAYYAEKGSGGYTGD
jgi:hypothetical protein